MELKLYRVRFPKSAQMLIDAPTSEEALVYARTKLIVEEESFERTYSDR